MGGFSAIFSRLEDPRTGNARRHDLCELLVIALCSCLCGGTTCTDMAEFAEDKEPFLRDFLTLKNGLPSHDTFSRLFRLLDPGAFGECFSQFMREFSQQTAGVVAIDGKTLRRSFDAANAKSALHMVSAWSCDERVVLAQIATDEKSNEITAVPRLLRLLNLEGRTVTADAMSCQREIAQQIVNQGGHYVLSLKGNQPAMLGDVKRFLADPEAQVIATRGTGGRRRSWAHRDPKRRRLLRYRLAARHPSLARSESHRRRSSHARIQARQWRPRHDRDRLLSALRTHHARASEPSRPRPLGRRDRIGMGTLKISGEARTSGRWW